MKSFPIALAVLLLAVPGRSTSAADLELRFSAIGVNGLDLHGNVPQGFSFELLNISDHDVLLAMPQIECQGADTGYILLHLILKPADGKWVGGRGCNVDRGQLRGRNSASSVLERTKSWKVLHAGEAITMKRFRDTLLFDDSRAGTYEFWAEYVPPAIDPVDAKLLRGSGIEFCDQRLQTNHLKFVSKP